MNFEKLILIVEDSPTQAEHIKHALERECYRVEVARNGKEALEIALQSKPSLVISDIIMPEMDGYSFCREVRANPALRDVPLILLTSLADPEDIIKGLACGADNFVTKPFSEEYLLNRIDYIFANQKFRVDERASMGIEIVFAGRKHFITSDRLQILNLLFSTYETAVQKNRELIRAQTELRAIAHELEDRIQHRTEVLTREIAERREAEERVREQAALLDQASDAIFVCNLEGRIRYWSRGAQQVFGWPASEANGRIAGELLQGDPAQIRNVAQALLEKGEWMGELAFKTKEGRAVLTQSRWTLLRDENGLPRSALAINTDITEKKLNEAKFLRIQRLESIGALAGGIAHDLNNALTPILMAAEMLREDLGRDDVLRVLDAMTISAQKASDMVKQILSFSRGAGGTHVVLQLKHLISDMEKLAKSTFPRSIQIQTKIEGSLLPVRGDATQLHQALLNLYVNSRDAMPEGGTLRVEASNIDVDASYPNRQLTGPHVVITISDTGHGIPPELIGKIFEPFFTTKEVGKGTGLGLSTVMGIVKVHKGFLDVCSEVGKGTRFRIYLPTAEGKVLTPPAEEYLPPSGAGQLVLIVDDEKAVLEMTKFLLEAYNYRTLTAEDGVEALALFKQTQDEIDIVLTDLMMPRMNGLDLIKNLQEIRPELKIISVSGLGSEAAMVQGNRELIRTTLLKPYHPDDLLKILHELLSNQPNKQGMLSTSMDKSPGC